MRAQSIVHRITSRVAPPAMALAAVAIAAAALTPIPAEAQQVCGPSYIVRPGDNLTEIAERCGITVPAILAVNPALRSGERLEPVEACGAFYTLRPGDQIPSVVVTGPAVEDAGCGTERAGRVRIMWRPR